MPSGKRPILGGDAAPMRIEFGMPEFAGNPLLKFFGDEVFQALGLLVQFIDRVIKHMEEERLNQAMVTDNLEGPFSSSFGQANTTMGFIFHERAVGPSQLLQHVGD